MKILVTGFTANKGGVESVIMNYLREFDHDKIQLDFLCTTENPVFADEIKEYGGKIFTITSPNKNFFKAKKEVRDFFETNAKNYSVLWRNSNILADLSNVKYAKKYGISNIIIHAHNSKNLHDGFKGKIIGLIHKFNRMRINKYVTNYWSCSLEASKFFFTKKIIESNKVLIINNAIDPKKYYFNEKVRINKRKELNLENKFVVGFVGRLSYQKNPIYLIDIFSSVYKKDNNAILLIVGVGPLKKEMEGEIISNDIPIESVMFVGARDDVPDLMQAMDCFVLPSLFEGLALVIVEAQFAGLKCIISKDNIPKEAAITDLVEFIPLDEQPKYWAKSILNTKSYIRKKEKNNLKESKFNIMNESSKISKIFINMKK